MAIVLDAFVGVLAKKLGVLALERATMLLGVEDDLVLLQTRMNSINNVLVDAERRRIKDNTVDDWVRQLKDVMYDADDMIDLCRIKGAELLSTPSSSVSCFRPILSCFTTSISLRNEIAVAIKSLNKKLEEIAKDKDKFNFIHTQQVIPSLGVNPSQTTEVMDPIVVGSEIENDTDDLVELLLKDNQQKHLLYAISGMGGIGKTTLAQKIFNDPRIANNFPVKAWVCISQSFDEIDLLSLIIRQLGGSQGAAVTKEELFPLLKRTVSGKEIFLVLDDVWKGNVWTDLLCIPLQSEGGARGCRILVTTRDENVAGEMGAVHIHRVKQLSTSSGWELLRRSVWGSGETEDAKSLQDIGIRIVEKCHHLPLAIKAISGVLKTKDKIGSQWEKVLMSDVWSISGLPKDLGALYLSYEDLPSHLKQCFLHCSLYPEDFVYYCPFVIREWVAGGFVQEQEDLSLEEVAEEYYKDLRRRNLLEVVPENFDGTMCKMHDVIRSLAQYLTRGENFYGNPQKLNTYGGVAAATMKLRNLSIESTEEVLIPTPVPDQKWLRTLIFSTKVPQKLDNDMPVRLPYLRFLILKGAGIESLPNSIGNLVHLRLLNLAGTKISSIPETIGRLINLQSLDLSFCHSLDALPQSIIKLLNLRHLIVSGTSLTHVPKGLGSLAQLNDLDGFVVGGHETLDHACSLADLATLSQLRRLHIDKMEEAAPGSLTLANMSHLTILVLCCKKLITPDVYNFSSEQEQQISKIRDVFNQLSPPQCLHDLRISGFFGREVPVWMTSTSLATSLPFLTGLELKLFTLCPLLPPLGKLPQLKYLIISSASSVITVGPEFLGVDSSGENDVSGFKAFPRLELLRMENMPKWKEWSFGIEIDGGASSSELRHLPCLKQLNIKDCPELRELPKGLRHCSPQSLYIIGANKLQEVDNLPLLTGWMQVKNCPSLKKVSRLLALKSLNIIECPSLVYVEKLDSLRNMYLEDGKMGCLPGWLSRLNQQRQPPPLHDNFELVMCTNKDLLLRCFKEPRSEAPEWPIIQQIPRVIAYELGGGARFSSTNKASTSRSAATTIIDDQD